MRHSNPTGDLERVFKYCVRAGVERLEARQRGLLRERGPRSTDRPRTARSRYIPRPIRRAVYERDGAQCTFQDEAGKRCAAKTLLELHHLDLYAEGGRHTVENLCLRCRPHNRYDAEQKLGEAFIEKCIARKRAAQGVHSNGGSSAKGSKAANGNGHDSGKRQLRPTAMPLTKAKKPRTGEARGSSDLRHSRA